jgi:hypothetical protein
VCRNASPRMAVRKRTTARTTLARSALRSLERAFTF